MNNVGQIVGLAYVNMGQFYESHAFLHMHGRGQMYDLNTRVINLRDWKRVSAEGIKALAGTMR